MRTINLIVVHCSATREDRPYPVTALIADHRQRFGFTGYHYYVARDGTVFQTRHENLIGAHARHYNRHSIGVCYEGGINRKGREDDTRTEAQRSALRHLLKSLKTRHPNAQILGHRDLPDVHKSCPCFNARDEYALL